MKAGVIYLFYSLFSFLCVRTLRGVRPRNNNDTCINGSGLSLISTQVVDARGYCADTIPLSQGRLRSRTATASIKHLRCPRSCCHDHGKMSLFTFLTYLLSISRLHNIDPPSKFPIFIPSFLLHSYSGDYLPSRVSLFDGRRFH